MFVYMPIPVHEGALGVVWTCSSCKGTGGTHGAACAGLDGCAASRCPVCVGWGFTGDPIGPYGHVLNRPEDNPDTGNGWQEP